MAHLPPQHLPPHLIEQILKRLDVRDLIRCKIISKSWLSMISDPSFIKSHLNHSYHRDRNHEEIGCRRLVMSRHACYYMYHQYEVDNQFFDYYKCHLLGSANGLACVSPSRTEIAVVNPATREVNKLSKPPIPDMAPLCWGFGYDLSTDDYKIVLGFRVSGNLTCFQVFCLRSHAWKAVGEVPYTCISRIGILCEGALHWVAYDASSERKVILSFRLSEEKFVEVPQPDDPSYQTHLARDSSTRLGTIEDCLCIFRRELLPSGLWVMKDYNVKQSWAVFGPEREIKQEAVHCIKQLKNYVPHKRSLCHETWLVRSLVFLGAPIYVQSLVSPHVNRILRRRRQTTTNVRPPKVTNWVLALYAVPCAGGGGGDGSGAGTSAAGGSGAVTSAAGGSGAGTNAVGGSGAGTSAVSGSGAGTNGGGGFGACTSAGSGSGARSSAGGHFGSGTSNSGSLGPDTGAGGGSRASGGFGANTGGGGGFGVGTSAGGGYGADTSTGGGYGAGTSSGGVYGAGTSAGGGYGFGTSAGGGYGAGTSAGGGDGASGSFGVGANVGGSFGANTSAKH